MVGKTNLSLLAYFPGDLRASRGTPIRVSNILTQLGKNGVRVYYAGGGFVEDLPFAGVLPLRGHIARVIDMIRVIRREQIDIFYAQTSSSLWTVPFIKLFTNARCGADFHSLRVEEERVYKHWGPLRTAFEKILERFLCLFLDFATGVSYMLGEYYGKAFPAYHVLPGGYDPQLFASTVTPDPEVVAWRAKSTLIGYAGNTKWYQGLDVVLRAFATLCKERPGAFKLLIISAAVSHDITEFIENNNLTEYVKVLEAQAHEKIPGLLVAADILTIVRPRDMVTEYAFPSKFAEYAALGRALVVSRVGDMPRYVDDGVSGILVEPGTDESLTDALRRLEDHAYRKKLGATLAERVRIELDVAVIGRNLLAFLQRHGRRVG